MLQPRGKWILKTLSEKEQMLGQIGWLVVLGFNATLTAMVISWRLVTHMCFLAFSHQYYRGERRKYTRKKVCLNRGSNSQPPGHESDTLTNEPPRRGKCWDRIFPPSIKMHALSYLIHVDDHIIVYEVILNNACCKIGNHITILTLYSIDTYFNTSTH